MKINDILNIILNINYIVGLYKMAEEGVDPQAVIFAERNVLVKMNEEGLVDNDKLQYLFLQTDFGPVLRRLTIQYLKNQIDYEQFENTTRKLIKEYLVKRK